VVGVRVVCVVGGEVRVVAGRVITVRRRGEVVRVDCLPMVVPSRLVGVVVELRCLAERW
jgi:hypothetical protein